uniref:Cysteine and serine rich nuclear protein 1 n=1 Tax=Poecilia formosa TaxID=48698 RepID=A0A087YCB3_POEFO
MRDILKRKFAEVEENPCEWESDGEGSSSENHNFTPHSPASASGSPNYTHEICEACGFNKPVWPILKKPKLSKRPSSVRFDQVTVFSFPRCQGFTSVPSRGGATLGMVRKHSALRRYTVDEHAVEQRSRRRERHREKLIQERFEALKHQLIISGAVDQSEAEKLTTDQVLGGDPDVHVSESDLEDGGYLQPFSSKQRQALLLAAGAKVIDKEEKRQLHALRLSREACGCDCRGFCEPETCACSQAGIKCQVDRFNFPCGCTKDSCGNVQGRIEFDARRVQSHYIHTLMRLELQRRLRRETLILGEQAVVTEEEDLLPFAMPAVPSFRCIPDQLVVEENSCSSDMSESSLSSSECDAGQFFSGTHTLPDRDADLTHDSSNKNFFSCAQNRHRCSSANAEDDDDTPHLPVVLVDNIDASRNYLDENANQSRDFFNEDSFEDFPNTPSPTMGYSFSGYMDLSLSSDSDLEFFHRDYPSGPLHSSFKEHRHSDSFQHFQLFSSVNLPPQESSTQLLESLIG